MANNLSKALEKYYTREKNKIIFKNGMSLNALALEMWERLGYREIDPSVISRVINGERSFTPSQLGMFCRILEIPIYEESGLERLMLENLAERVGISFDFEIDVDGGRTLRETSAGELEKVTQLEACGNLDLANEWIDLLYERLKEALARSASSSRGEILKILVRVIYRKYHILSLHFPVVRLEKEYPPLVLEMRKYAREIEELEYSSLADFTSGHFYYLLASSCPFRVKANKKAVFYLKRALLGQDYTWERWPETMRLLALDFAYLDDRSSFLRVEEEMKGVVKRGPFSLSETCQIYEGLARAEAALKIDSFEETMGEAWRAYRGLSRPTDKIAARRIQLARTEIEAYAGTNWASRSYLECVGIGAMAFANEHGFGRYTQKIWELLNRLL